MRAWTIKDWAMRPRSTVALTEENLTMISTEEDEKAVGGGEAVGKKDQVEQELNSE